MTHPFIDSLTQHDGYHMFYLVYGCKGKYHIHREPIKFTFNQKKRTMRGKLGDKFTKCIENSSEDKIVFAIWREVIDHGSANEIDFEQTEVALNAISITIYPSIIETFVYDNVEGLICSDSRTAMINGNRNYLNYLITYLKTNSREDTTTISNISFEIKLK